MTLLGYTVIVISAIVLTANIAVLLVLVRILVTKSYKPYIERRYEEQGVRFDEQMRRIRKDLDK